MNMNFQQNIVIAGPCAAESREQVMASAIEAKKRGINYMRMSLWKPRTSPGFEGIKEKGIDLLVEVAKNGVNPATEVLSADQAKLVIDRLFSQVDKTELLLWIGARNQNHYVQRDIAKVAAQDKRVRLLIKNQPWPSKDHWIGIVQHVLDGGISQDKLILCHRGFSPYGRNHYNLRNIPDFRLAMEVKQATGIPMVFDPSHTGGSISNVFLMVKKSKKYSFDGLMIEVHPRPTGALTDAAQQLTWSQYDSLCSQDTHNIS